MLTQRDQFTSSQLPFSDQELIHQQHKQRLHNHSHSRKSNAPLGKVRRTPPLAVRDVVYLYADRNKTRSRDCYIVTAENGSWLNIRKFTNSQLKNNTYRVKRNDCYKVESRIPTKSRTDNVSSDQSDDETRMDIPTVTLPPTPPVVPPEIATVPSQDEQYAETPPMDSIDVTSSGAPDHMTDDNIVPPRRSTRERRPPQHFADYVTDF